MEGKWLIQDTSYWRACHYGDVQVNRINLKCSNCGYRNFKKIRFRQCPKCKTDMRGEEDD